MAEPLLTPTFIRQLDRLELQTRRILGGVMKGERRSKRKGVSIDFADYRQYTSGDDLRFLDWNIYGRLDRLFIKIFHEEQDLQAHILLDASKSMDFGEANKLAFAKRLAAAIAYIGLSNTDKIGISCFQAGTKQIFQPARGQHQIRRMLAFLDKIEADGETSLHATAREFSLRVTGRSVVIIISDFLDPAGFQPALRWLMRPNYDVHVIHTLAPEEIDPKIGGHVELLDIESGHKVELTINARLKEIYTSNVEAYCSQIQEFCGKYGMSYSLVRTDATLEDVILKRLRESGLVKL